MYTVSIFITLKACPCMHGCGFSDRRIASRGLSVKNVIAAFIHCIFPSVVGHNGICLVHKVNNTESGKLIISFSFPNQK
jgi:hypothetical protein